MASEHRAGRPRASSPEAIAEAATELFLERGYVQTSIADITQRAGVSRSSFFNYFASKADMLWRAFDERLAAVTVALATHVTLRAALERAGEHFAPDALALAIANAEQMGLADELERERAIRHARLSHAVAGRLVRDGADELAAEVRGGAYAAAVLAAIWRWADAGPGRTGLGDVLAGALDAADGVSGAGVVRQLRLVVRAGDFDEALEFYRDVLGLVERESYQGEGGARVTILSAGEATLELSNPAQVDLIDRVETDGGASDRLRVAFEVGDTAAVVERLLGAGARLEASARITPWRSLNARLRGPAGLQLTLFQELGDE